MLARIDGFTQFMQEEVENLLRDSVSNLSRKIAIGNIEHRI
jgi:hypothetical protein